MVVVVFEFEFFGNEFGFVVSNDDVVLMVDILVVINFILDVNNCKELERIV